MSDLAAIRPPIEDADTVILRRVDYEALMREAEDAADAARNFRPMGRVS